MFIRFFALETLALWHDATTIHTVLLIVLILIFLGLLSMMIIFYVTGKRKLSCLIQKATWLEEQNQLIEKEARTDPLTTLLNRRGMDDKIQDEVNRFTRSQRPFCFIMADIDDFKKFNDDYGHNCGDYILKNIAHLMKSKIRRQDYICRWGGEEFLFLLPETIEKGGYVLAEKLREAIASHGFSCNDSEYKITLSFGVAEYNPKNSVESSIKLADLALYKSKSLGKNMVSHASDLHIN